MSSGEFNEFGILIGGRPKAEKRPFSEWVKEINPDFLSEERKIAKAYCMGMSVSCTNSMLSDNADMSLPGCTPAKGLNFASLSKPKKILYPASPTKKLDRAISALSAKNVDELLRRLESRK